jgi:hypothetical protein
MIAMAPTLADSFEWIDDETAVPDLLAEGRFEGMRRTTAIFAVMAVAIVVLLTAVILQTAYHALILLWFWVGTPLLVLAKAVVHAGARRQVSRVAG